MPRAEDVFHPNVILSTSTIIAQRMLSRLCHSCPGSFTLSIELLSFRRGIFGHKLQRKSMATRRSSRSASKAAAVTEDAAPAVINGMAREV